MYVRSLLFDNKPDFYFVSCTLYLSFFISSQHLNDKDSQVDVNWQAYFKGVKGQRAASGSA